MKAERGWYRLPCWNALSEEQQRRLIEHGNLPIGWQPEGSSCHRGAQVEVTTMDDEAPGPRFYCYPCATEYLYERSRWGNPVKEAVDG